MKNADLRFVLNWRNHPTIREMSLDSREISEEDHAKWFLSNDRIKMVFEINETPAGIVRLDYLPEEKLDTYQWSFYLNPFDIPLPGTGKMMLTQVIQFLRLNNGIGIIGEVKNENLRSIRLHKQLGFNEVQPSYDGKSRRFFKQL